VPDFLAAAVRARAALTIASERVREKYGMPVLGGRWANWPASKPRPAASSQRPGPDSPCVTVTGISKI